MRIYCRVTPTSITKTTGTLQAMASYVNNGAKWATDQACQDIMKMSLQEVPRVSGTLASSIGYRIEKAGKSRFMGIVSYGNGNPINPVNGQAVQDYMVRQHEDLTLWHDVGKAKFLEDPCRAYADSGEYAALMAEATRRAIERKELIERNKKEREIAALKAQMRADLERNKARRDEHYGASRAGRAQGARERKRGSSDAPQSASDLARILAGE